MVVKETVHVNSPGSAKSNSSDRSSVVVPSATRVTVQANSPRPEAPKHEKLRIPRSLQLQLARSLTFGVIGEDSQLYPSSQWVTENRNRYDGQIPEVAKTKSDFVITSLDTRKHKPQTTQIFHIKRINKKPVCSVQASFEEGKFSEEARDPRSVYKTSYQSSTECWGAEESHLHRQDREAAEGIVPINDRGSHFDVRTEMMLPVCDSTVIPAAHNPHQYLLRKRKVPPPFTSSGVVYKALERPRMTSYHPGMPPTGDLPFQNEAAGITTERQSDRISIMSLSGQQFSRRKCIHPPPSHIRAVSLVPYPPIHNVMSSLSGKEFTRKRPVKPLPRDLKIRWEPNGCPKPLQIPTD